VGAIVFIINAGIVEWLARSIGPIWAQALAFPIAASIAWWLNRRYTFGPSHNVWHREWLRYAVANMLGWFATNGVYFFLSCNFRWHIATQRSLSLQELWRV
jgi:putative flippase GtrA